MDARASISVDMQRGARGCPPNSASVLMLDDTQIVAVLTALGHQARLKLWRLLLPYGEAGMPAGTIAARMSIVPSSLSFHLRLMTQAGILIQRRSSRHIIYAVNTDLVFGLSQLFAALLLRADTEPG
jgi:DNA-binding transcriptional ArsR family regulator